MKKNIKKQDALDYHDGGRPGKIEVVPTKKTKTQRDLALAYSPGVAEPCKEISKNIEDVYKYTAKGNLVGVITNGTAVLGLGDIGPEASKPVMEGKGILFKIFAGIDCFDIEVNAKTVDEFVTVVKALEPTFGGINLEDIKAPESFEIERRLKAETNIPVMHDDQHGTAIISAAALLNALELQEKNIEDITLVMSGAGAAAMSCAKLYIKLGLKRENIIMLDSKGVLNKSREGLDQYKSEFVSHHEVNTLEEAIKGADVFVGLSSGNIVSKEMVVSMAKKPIVFALANPEPEIDYHVATSAREDIIMATGRSDFPNQVNNVLGFPFIFRGALDVRATEINEEMKLACVYALANLTKETVPDIVNMAYSLKNLSFSKDYIIPKPMDPRLLTTIAPAVAKAAMKSGVAKIQIKNWEQYEDDLKKKMGVENQIIRIISNKARADLKRVVFAEADNYKMLKAAEIVIEDKLAEPILLGNEEKIKQLIQEHNIEHLNNVLIIDPRSEKTRNKREEFGHLLYEKRKRKGVLMHECIKLMYERNFYGCSMVETGEADALISGMTRKYPDTIRPALQIIGTKESTNVLAGMYIMLTQKGPLFFADTTVNRNPTAEELAEITQLTAHAVRQFNIIPRIALLSYSNFGSARGDDADKVIQAVSILKRQNPELIVDGEMQANFALNSDLLKENFSFSDLTSGSANTLLFPNLAAGNIAYKLLQEVSDIDTIGPILLGIKKPIHVMQMGSSVREIVNMVTLAAVEAQQNEQE